MQLLKTSINYSLKYKYFLLYLITSELQATFFYSIY